MVRPARRSTLRDDEQTAKGEESGSVGASRVVRAQGFGVLGEEVCSVTTQSVEVGPDHRPSGPLGYGILAGQCLLIDRLPDVHGPGQG